MSSISHEVPAPDRAIRILEAALELVARWGYDKTSIDDIARAAGVAKGTIYLHFESREALFVALLRRERLLALETVRADLTRAAGAVSLTDLVRASVAAASGRPLLRALLVKDTEVLGRLRRERAPGDREGAGRRGFHAYLERLRSLGVIRSDQPVTVQVGILSTILAGALVAPMLLPKEIFEGGPAPHEMVAEIVARTFEPPRRVSKSIAQEASAATLRYVDAETGAARQKLRLALAPARRSRGGS